jgi:predicted O-methyltransferase YrrM
MLLYRRVTGMTAPHGVEIGRFNGASTLLLSLAVGSEGKLTSIDIAPRADIALSRRLHEFGLHRRVNLIAADANTVMVDAPLDFVFIDGDHTYEGAARDHRRWTPLLKPGGVAFYHDMAQARPMATQVGDLKRLRQEIIDREAGALELVEEAGSICVFQRRGLL